MVNTTVRSCDPEANKRPSQSDSDIELIAPDISGINLALVVRTTRGFSNGSYGITII